MRKRLTVFCIMAILIPFLFPSAAPAQRCVSVLPDTTVVTTDMQFSLDVVVNDPVDSLMGFDVIVGFDRSYLEVVRVKKGSLLAASGYATFFGWLNEGCACDSIFVNGSILGNTVDGPGTLFTIKADIVIRRSDLRNGMNRTLSHLSENALVIVEPPIASDASSWSRVKALYK
jgi:hypothetical protein